MTFPVYVRELLDFDLMIEIFIDEEYRLPPANVDDVKVIFDVGSNIGITVLYFLSKYPNAKVFAFEPVGLNIERLAKNVRYFENRVVLCPRAVYYSENGRIEMHINPRLHWSSSVSNRKNNTEIVVVDTITLEKAMKENNIEAIDILKFDAEGSEYNVLSHFKNMNTVSLFIGEFHPDLAGDEYCDVSKFFGGHIMLFRRNIGGSRYVAAFSHKSKS